MRGIVKNARGKLKENGVEDMARKTFVAYFDMIDDAKEAITALRKAGFSTTLDKIDRGTPDPNLSVSALMVGFLPNLAHGIFGAGHREEERANKDGAYLLILVDHKHSEEEVHKIIANYDGILLDKEQT
jgi:hypothetical protein